MPLISTQEMAERFSASRRMTEGASPGLLGRLGLLEREDRMLLELVLRGRMSRRELASLYRCPAGTVTRRVQRLAARLHDPLVVALCDPKCPLPPEYRQLGLEYFLRGQSIRAMADRHLLRPGQVRQMIEFVRGWGRGVRSVRR